MLKSTITLVAAFGLLLAGQAVAADVKAKKPTPTEWTFEGDVVSVDVSAKKVTVRSTEKDTDVAMTFDVEPTTSIRIEDELAPLRELRKDDHVTITYKMIGSAQLAKGIRRQKKTT